MRLMIDQEISGSFRTEPDDDMIICRCRGSNQRGNSQSGARWNVHTDGDPPVFKNRHGTLSGTDLCKAGQRNRGKRTERIPGRTGTGNIPGTDASDRDARVCGRGKGGRGR